jgi:two-component system sensor histidine kinase DesK
MSNDGARPSRRAPGTGLAGLAERVEVLGGTLTAGPRDRDGFLLRAVVPVGEP